MTDSLIPAAEYVRMSTEDQKYSIANQQAVIADYARTNGFEIVASYADLGISGLNLKHRHGLQALLKAVLGGNATFRMILVLDISRWGRFQDIDEGAYYEFLCRQAGFRIVYCAEPFANDLSPYSSLVKTIKRTMAAEYSRELSVKVFRGQARLATMGFKQGGTAGVGLRRLLIDEHGKSKQLLAFGERKNLVSDRVILVQGPDPEVKLVRKIFEWVRDGRSPKSIAEELRAKKTLGLRWSKYSIYRMVRHPKYVGIHVFNRTSTKLQSPRTHNPPEQWITKEGAFVPVVSPALFESVQKRLANLTCRLSNEELIRRLRRLYERHGCLTRVIITKSRGVPSISTYRNRFGSLRSAICQAGSPDGKPPLSSREFIAGLRQRTWRQLKVGLRNHGTKLLPRSREPYYIHVPGAPLLKLVIAHRLETGGRRRAWWIGPQHSTAIGDSIVALLSLDGKEIAEYLIVTPLTSKPIKRYVFYEARIPYISLARFGSHLELFDALKRIRYL